MSVSHATRTHTCGELRLAHLGEPVILKGWVDTRRDLGGLIFIDLRDRYGVTQVVFSPQDNATAHELAQRLRSEFVISVQGRVDNRSPETINPKFPTGQVEVRVTDLEILNAAEPTPFPISIHEEKTNKANEDLRLTYRYLDMRRAEVKDKMLLRHRLYQIVRQHLDRHDFVEVETPVLMKSTPEGARDYLVPSRVHPGQFYALPQSPQMYKQILMIAGLDRYFQIVKCFRDEDLRADRQPEFTQIDVEMTFATEDMVFALMEELMVDIWRDLKGIEVQTPFLRMPYAEAIRRFGSDKPDLRFGLEVQTISDAFADSPFRVFQNVLDQQGAIVALRIAGEGHRGRGYMDRLDKDIVRKRIGAGGLVYFKIAEDGSVHSSVKEAVLPTSYVQNAIEAVGGENGDLILVLAGPAPKVYEQMGTLRVHMARELELIPEGNTGPYNFLWVTDFPLLEWSEDDERWVARHHPFTSPKPEDLALLETDPGQARARAYDLVLNGFEIGGGSIRIHEREVQEHMFDRLGIEREEAEERFGFLLNAFRYGAPPHGGIALGLDRLAMLLTGAASLREVIAFPKTQRAQELMVQSPAGVDAHQLDDLHLRIVPPKKS